MFNTEIFSWQRMFQRVGLVVLAFGLFGVLAMQAPAAVYAAGITVNTTADEDNTGAGCSLREAITAANTNAAYGGCTSGAPGADIITLPAGTYTLSIAGTGEDANATGDLDITEELTINGAGASSTIIQAGTVGYPSESANGIDRVMEMHGSDPITLNGVTIANGKAALLLGGGIFAFDGATVTVINSRFSANSATFGGGGIFTNGGAVILTNSTVSGNFGGSGGGGVSANTLLTVANSTISDNVAGNGGGILFADTLNITNSTVSGNTAGNYGGGMFDAGGTGAVRNSTFSDNSAPHGGGIVVYGATLNLYNSILANSNAGSDCYNDSGTVSGDHNLIETDSPSGNACGTTSPINGSDPILGALADNGGPTQTMAIDTSSPAYNAGDNTTCAAAPVSNKDQRGVTRPQDGTCDIGAFEFAASYCEVELPGRATLLKPVMDKTMNKAKVAFDWTDAVCATNYKIRIKNTTTHVNVKRTVTASKVKVALGHGNYKWFVWACNANGCTKSEVFKFTN